MKYENKKKDPEISIIVPVYNVEKYLRKCIESIQKQTFYNIEIILVDDGSTDNSSKICDDFANRDKRIKVFHLENGGVSRARNYGMDKAIGKYIMFCDSDDYVDEKWCEILYKYIEKYPSSWINCGMKVINLFDSCEFNAIYDFKKNVSFIDKMEYYKLLKCGIAPYSGNKIFSKEKLKNNNIKFDENRSLGEDVIFTIEYLKLCDNILCINEYLYYYIRYGENTLTTKYVWNEFDTVADLYKYRKDFISEEDKQEFYSQYTYTFLKALNNTFDKRNNQSLFQKLKYNNKCINNEEFIECINNVVNHNESKIYINLLKSKNYYLVYLVQKICSIKNYILKK